MVKNPINLNTGNVIRWNSSGVETAAQTNYEIDFLSNGFKIRNNSNDINVNTGEYIYAAWAELPAFNLYGGQPMQEITKKINSCRYKLMIL